MGENEDKNLYKQSPSCTGLYIKTDTLESLVPSSCGYILAAAKKNVDWFIDYLIHVDQRVIG